MSDMDNILNVNAIQKVNWTEYDQINLLYSNINSIRNKLYDLEDVAHSSTSKIIHFIALTETRIFDTETDFINLPNYNSYFLVQYSCNSINKCIFHTRIEPQYADYF